MIYRNGKKIFYLHKRFRQLTISKSILAVCIYFCNKSNETMRDCAIIKHL